MEAWVPWGTSTTSTKKTLIVALWTLNTQGMRHATVDLRWHVLKKCVEHAYELALKRLGTQHLDLSDKPFALFVAPEYLMAHPDPSGGHVEGSRRHVDEVDKDTQLQRYIGLSTTCKGMLMVPGTIAWRKPLERSGLDQFHSKPGPLQNQAKTVSRYDKAIGSLQSYMERRGWGPAYLDWPLSGNLNSGRVAPTTRQKLDALSTAKVVGPLARAGFTAWGPDDLRYLARNTAYVLLDGTVLCKYNKQGDFHEVLVGKDTVHIPGKLDGRFSVKPTNPAQRAIDFGLEICLDHAGQAVEREIKHLGKVDVHIITSAQLPTEKANVATTNTGYVVHASSNKAYTGVWSRGYFGGLSDVKAIWAEPFLGHPLQLYQIELDLAHVVPTKETVKTVGGSSNWFG